MGATTTPDKYAQGRECVRKLRTHSRGRERHGESEKERQSITRLTSWDKNHHNFYYQLTTWTHGTTTTTATIRCRPEPSRAAMQWLESIRCDCVCLCLQPLPLYTLPPSLPLSACTRLRQLRCMRESETKQQQSRHTHAARRGNSNNNTIRKRVIALMDLLIASLTPSLASSTALALPLPLHLPQPDCRLPASLVCRCERRSRHRTLPAYERGRQRATIKI